jgi:hypothetical protein
MKRFLLLLILSMALGVVQARAASSEEALGVFRGSDWSKFSDYFSAVRVTGAGFLELDAKEGFEKAGMMRQYKVMQDVVRTWRERRGQRGFYNAPVVAVKTSNGGSLWTMTERFKRVEKIESWDMLTPAPASLSRIAGRFYAYFGFSMRGVPSEGSSTVNMSVNLRMGSYLLRNVLDSAFTFDFGPTINSSSSGATSSSLAMNLGLMMRVHFPLGKQSRIRGNLGGGLDFGLSAASGTSSTNVTGYGLAGFMVPLGSSASLDVSSKIQKSPMILVGITSFFGRSK